MSRKLESSKTSEVLRSLQLVGYFRNISDMYQVGMADIVGSYKGKFYAIEVKAVTEVPQDGLAPPKSGHVFTPEQMKELANVEHDGLGAAIALVICGDKGFWFTQEQVDRTTGQVNIVRALENHRYIKKVDGRWDVLPMLEFFHEQAGFDSGRKRLIC